MRPWLSVIMPTYNGERFLDQALASVAAQGDRQLEVVAVDDGSTDRTVAVLRRWSQVLRLRIIERRRSGNWVASTVAGMQVAEGRYLCWLHQDDTWRPGRAAAVRRALSLQPRAAVLVHPCWYSDERGRRIGYWRCALPRSRRLLRFDEAAAPLLVQCSIATCGTVFGADAARELGPPDTTLVYHADWDYWLRLARLGRTLHLAAPLAAFRLHAASQTIARAAEADSRLIEARTVLWRHLPHFAAAGADSERVSRLAFVSAEVNYALNSLLAGRTIDVWSLLRRLTALGPANWSTLLRDSQLIERCASRLQTGAGLRPLLRTRLAGIAVGSERASAAPGHHLVIPNACDAHGPPKLG